VAKEDFVPYILLDLAGRYSDLFPSLKDCYEIEDCKEIAKNLDIKEYYRHGYQFNLDDHSVLFFMSEKDAEECAYLRVEEMLDEPELFNRDWLKDYLYMSDLDIRLFLDDLEEIYSEQGDMSEEEIEKRLNEARKVLEYDPLDFLIGELGYDEKSAFEMLYINYSEAAKNAVNIDGWAHFLGRYDGNGWEVSIPEGGSVYYVLGD